MKKSYLESSSKIVDSSIAIIIPVYNVEKYLAQTLLSIQNQSCLPNEIIIIDDGSTDNSYDILKKFKKILNLKIIRTRNRGLGPARNLGRNIAKSEYIYFLDSDDLIKNDLIFTIRSTIKKFNKPDMILFSGEVFSDSKLSSKTLNLKFTLSGKFVQGSGLITKLINKKEALPQAGRYLTKSSLWLSNNIYYPAIIYEDEAVFLPLLALSKNTVVIPEIYLKYRINRVDSLTNKTPTDIYAISYLKIIIMITKFMKKNPEIIKLDLSSWRYRLGRNGLKYIGMCMKTSIHNVSWKIIILLIINVNSFKYPFKCLWRVFKYLLSNFPKIMR